MQRLCVTLLGGMLTAATVSPVAPACAATTVASNLAGARDFDFLIGEWRVHHRVKRATGTEEHRFDTPNGVTHGIALRAYDPRVGQWAIWWIDGRTPHRMDPWVKGRFDQGVGTFNSDVSLDGKPTRVRFIWSEITPTSARWEQAYSADDGKTWGNELDHGVSPGA